MMPGRIGCDVTEISRARGGRNSNSRDRNRASYACITAPELIASTDIEGTTTMVCGSWLNRSIDFHNGTSFFCNRLNSACESITSFDSDIAPLKLKAPNHKLQIPGKLQ